MYTVEIGAKNNNSVQLYCLSIKHEPKGQHDDGGTNNQQNLPQPSIVADWAKGVYQEPNPRSVDKHIKQMVKVN